MKKLFNTLLILFALAIPASLSAQGVISSVVPNSAAGGTTVDIVIKGAGTKFTDKSEIFLGTTKLPVLSIAVPDPETIKLKLDIPMVPAQDYPLTVVSPDGGVTTAYAFKVFEPGKEVNVVVNVVPIQSINMADLDPANPANAPMLFTVSLFNDGAQRNNCKIVMTLSGELNNLIGSASRKGLNILPNGILSFSNKDFTDYSVNTSNAAFFEKAIKAGALPADVYTYQIDLFDEKGNKIGSGSGKNTIFNQITKPELISPGNDFSRPQEGLRNKQPLFQWFSQGNDFEFSLYMINPGQSTAEEITLNRPVFRQSGIKTTSFQYPAGAEMLEEGKSYAWQIKYNTIGASGVNQIASEVYWFKFSASGPAPVVVGDIKLTPEDCYININSPKQFTAQVFGTNNEPLKGQTIEWKVIPSDAGSIDPYGMFTASGKTGSCAVVARVGEVQEYATVNVVNINGSDWSMKELLQKLFGLPAQK